MSTRRNIFYVVGFLFITVLMSGFGHAMSSEAAQEQQKRQEAYRELKQRQSLLLSMVPVDALIEIMVYDFTNYQDFYKFRNGLNKWAHISKIFKLIVNEKKEIGFLAELTSPVHSAAAQGLAQEIIKYKLEHQQVNVKDRFGLRPVMYAAIYGFDNVVLLFKAAGLDRSFYRGETSLLDHCLFNKKDKLLQFLGSNYSLTHEDIQHYSQLLFLALENNNVEQVRFLLASNRGFWMQDQKLQKKCQEMIEKGQLNEAASTLLFILQCHIEDKCFILNGPFFAFIKIFNANINVEDVHGEPLLSCAIRAGYDLAFLQECVAYGADLNRLSKHEKVTPLMVAAARGRVDVVILLLEQPGCNINQTSPSGETALMTASGHGKNKVVATLIGYPHIDLDAQTCNGKTALTLAAQKGHKNCLKQLLSTKAKREGNSSIKGLFCLALDHNKPSIVGLLIENKADVNDSINGEFTPLMHAARFGLAIAEFLVDIPNININKAKSDGWNALMLAAENNHDKVLKLLLEHGALVNEKDKTGCTAFFNAFTQGFLSCAEMLVAHKADVNNPNDFGYTLTMVAANKNALKDVQWLIEHNASVNCAANNNYTALHAAACGGSIDCLKYLLDHGAQESLDKALLDNIINTDRNQNIGLFTPLHYAVDRAHTECIKILVVEGANPNVPSSLGLTPLEMAKEKGLLPFMQVAHDKNYFNNSSHHKESN